MASQPVGNLSKEDSDEEWLNELLSKTENLNINDNDLESNGNTKENKITISEWLKEFESPFLWDSQEERGLGTKQVILRALEKLDELKIESPEFSMERFVTLLKLVLEYYILGNTKKSWKFMTYTENLLEKSVTQTDRFYQKSKLSLGHVISSTKAQLLALTGEEEKSRKIGENIIPVNVMVNQEKAGLYCMKARFFLYSGYENGEDIAVKFARKALELEPDNGEWEYFLAKVLRQQRKQVPFSADIPREELVLLESAVEKEKNAKYLVYLAQVYRECGLQAFRNYKDQPGFFSSELHATIEDMSVKSLNYYKEALELGSDSPSTLRRVGMGIMYLPRHMTDYNLALKCLQRSLELSDNQTTQHILGTFYHRYGNDDRKALEYFKKTFESMSHAGLSDMVRLKYKLEPDYDPCADLETGLSWKMKKSNHTLLRVQLGAYFLLIKRDLLSSIDHFAQVVAEDKDTVHMKKFKSFFLRMNDTIDLYRYLVNEALLFLQNDSPSKSVNSSTSSEEEIRVRNFGRVEDLLEKISDIHPELMEIKPNPSLVDNLCQTSIDIERRASSNVRSGNRGGRPYQQRGRGGRGGNRFGERGNTSQGTSPGDALERRGRFSVVNQRDRQDSTGDTETYVRVDHHVERRGDYPETQMRRGGNKDRSNWRERQSYGGDDNSPRSGGENYRRRGSNNYHGRGSDNRGRGSDNYRGRDGSSRESWRKN